MKRLHKIIKGCAPNYYIPIKFKSGFTLIELGVAIGIFSTLIGIATINLLKAQNRSTLSASVEIFVTDLKSQQLRAMAGDTDGQPSANDYGVHIETNSYTLFRNSYGTVNSVVYLPSPTEFVNPNEEILFAKGSGEAASSTSVVLRNPNDGSQKTVNINKLGVITAVN